MRSWGPNWGWEHFIWWGEDPLKPEEDCCWCLQSYFWSPCSWVVPANIESELGTSFSLFTEASVKLKQAEVHKHLQTRICPRPPSSHRKKSTLSCFKPMRRRAGMPQPAALQAPGIWVGPSWGPQCLSWAQGGCTVGVTIGGTNKDLLCWARLSGHGQHMLWSLLCSHIWCRRILFRIQIPHPWHCSALPPRKLSGVQMPCWSSIPASQLLLVEERYTPEPLRFLPTVPSTYTCKNKTRNRIDAELCLLQQ